MFSPPPGKALRPRGRREGTPKCARSLRGRGPARVQGPDGIPAFQIITALEEDSTAQKMQLGYRLQQVAAAVENKVTDL